ncbi:DUF2218 domain-containing protein [Hoyosella rhizosphaerae]|uniref:DUF2218 domain-containing protein n=1 Tax=Hoyosella rhizosphaerae TaxID=1755582 RepID=A0A916U883_9ACTN|nr:DUF2218 domain-containing protein [Hoyosella rhizosphaerae]MBN4927570.1 DUF2218 domain-containing protein [Hoyosella rhizosphaerae]GGC63437.1 hypothetical protein GCM10011410_14850 [Hoyosella rhizosphaerae]
MPESVAHVATDRADRFLKQLVSHFGQQIPVVQEGPRAEFLFDLGHGACEAKNNKLNLAVTARSAEDLSTLQKIFTHHIERFGQQENLSVSWKTKATA